MVKVPIENPTKKANRPKALLSGLSLSEYGSEGSRVLLRGLSEYGSVAYLVERPTWDTRTEQYSDTVLFCTFFRSPKRTHKAKESHEQHQRILSVSRWAPFVAHILRVFRLVRNPVDVDRLGEFTEIEGPKRCSAWCRGLNWAYLKLNSGGNFA